MKNVEIIEQLAAIKDADGNKVFDVQFLEKRYGDVDVTREDIVRDAMQSLTETDGREIYVQSFLDKRDKDSEGILGEIVDSLAALTNDEGEPIFSKSCLWEHYQSERQITSLRKFLMSQPTKEEVLMDCARETTEKHACDAFCRVVRDNGLCKDNCESCNLCMEFKAQMTVNSAKNLKASMPEKANLNLDFMNKANTHLIFEGVECSGDLREERISSYEVITYVDKLTFRLQGSDFDAFKTVFDELTRLGGKDYMSCSVQDMQTYDRMMHFSCNITGLYPEIALYDGTFTSFDENTGEVTFVPYRTYWKY